MTYRLGLTGSIGMGKSTTARMFADLGVPVWDADAAVHRLYAAGGAGAAAIAALYPDAVGPQGVDRTALSAIIARDPAALPAIEAAIHPLVAADRQDFARANPASLQVFDVPLLFETGADAWMDGVAVVSTDSARQAARVLARPGMTRARFDAILARQMPDAEKRARADWVIPTDTLQSARAAVRAIVDQIRGPHA